MNKNLFLKGSIILNIIFIIGFLFLGYKFRAKIFDQIASFSTCNVVMFGNSLTADGQWSKDLNRLDIKNSGIAGYTTSQFVWVLNDAVVKYEPEICFIEGGINDIGLGISLNRIYENFQSLVDTLLQYGIEPVLQSTLYVNYSNDSTNGFINSQVDSINNYLIRLADTNEIKYLDLNQFLSENGRLRIEFSRDGLHINDAGYEIWVREIKKLLSSMEL